MHVAATHLLVATCCGVLTGFAELAIMWFRQVAFGRMAFGSRHMLWMTPSAYALLFGILGLVPGVAALVAPRWATIRVSLFGFLALGVFCLFLPLPQMHRLAALLIALGVAMQTTRALTAPGRDPEHVVRRATRWSVAGVLVAALGTGGWALVREGRTLSGIGRADPAAPNVLLIIWDTVRAASLSLYGYPQPTTPTLERLAQDGVVFDWAIATSPWTLPSHGTMFTGHFPHDLSTDWFTPLDGTFPTIAEVFRDHGYATGGFSANLHYATHHTGLDRGFRTYRDYRLSFAQALLSTQLWNSRLVHALLGSRTPGEVVAALLAFDWEAYPKPGYHLKPAADVNAQFLNWRSKIDRRPYFAFLNYMDAHEPYWSPPTDLVRFAGGTDLENQYDAAIAYLDAQVDDLLRKLQEQGELDNTLVVITSDHGELFGEHGLHRHGHGLYWRLLHVPLLALLPGRVVSSTRVTEPASLRDLPRTLLELAGVDGGSQFPGKSLSRYWNGSETEAAVLLSEVEQGHNTPPGWPISRGPMKSLVGRGMHYILNGDGEEELYDYVADDAEAINLLHSPDSAGMVPVVSWFRQELKRVLREE